MKYLILLFLFVWAPGAESSDTKDKNLAQTQPTTRGIMDEFLGEITALKDVMVSEEKFLDPKNEIEIVGRLKRMSEVSGKVVHNPDFKAPVFRPSAVVLREHIIDTERVFRSGNMNYARWMLNSTFLFTIRNFSKAHELYGQAIANYPKNRLSSDKLEIALEREVSYFARINRDAAGGAKILEKYLKIKALAAYLKKGLETWISQFKQWTPEEIFELKDPTEDQVKIFIQRHLAKNTPNEKADNPNVVNDLYASGILYEFLSRHPKTALTPEILYWLAICDRGVNNNFFYSLADIYLKDCITQFPRTPSAAKCYKEYEENTIASYSGSGGTHLPADVSEEMNHLKALLK